MPASSGSRVVHFVSVAKTFVDEEHGVNPVLRRTTLTLPADRRVAILSAAGAGKTLVLQLIAGLVEPDEGAVIAPLRLSPLLNAGPLFHPQLSGYDNVRFLARSCAADPDRLIVAVERFCAAEGLLARPGKDLDAEQRKGFEAAAAVLLPFDCYLLDNIAQLAEDMAERFFATAGNRGAGVIFACGQARRVRQLAELVVVIRDQTLYLFDQVEEAIRFHERD